MRFYARALYAITLLRFTLFGFGKSEERKEHKRTLPAFTAVVTVSSDFTLLRFMLHALRLTLLGSLYS